MTTTPKRAVVLLSGGLDSSTAAAIARSEGYELYTLAFDYGQRHRRELESARAVSAALGAVDHRVVSFDLRAFGGSALTADLPVPHGRDTAEMGHDIPITYVPGRNLIFLSFATAYAEVVGADDIFMGINQQDYSVGGKTQIWVKGSQWTRLMAIEDFYLLPEDTYETMAVDPQTLALGWHKIQGRFQHNVADKKCYRVQLERGLTIEVTEDHSLFTIDPVTAHIQTIKGSDISEGTPLVVPFDLSVAHDAWAEDLESVDLRTLIPREGRKNQSSVVMTDEYLTNRLDRCRVPLDFPITDDFLYLVGLWLAEGGKDPLSDNTLLCFSIGGTLGAVETLQKYFAQYHVEVYKSPSNDFDYSIASSVFDAIFHHFGLLGTAKRGEKKFPTFFWDLSQRQRRLIVAGLWDGDGNQASHGECTMAQKSHQIIDELASCLILDGIFPARRYGLHEQKILVMSRSQDMQKFFDLYPLRHPLKISSLQLAISRPGRDKVTGLWKCEGIWNAVSQAQLPPGRKTYIYNAGGKYDLEGVRGQRSAFLEVPALHTLVQSRLAFLQVESIEEISEEYMYDLSVEGAENFIANGILAHNSGYPDCREEFLEAFVKTANLATKAGTQDGRELHIHAPLIQMTKAQIIERGLALGVPYALTWSCYEGGERACGTCDSCLLRLKGFAEVGATDPIPYENH
jgi:7-cyano-7-deazaguanine synthase in queuosine biosynthesis